MKVGRNSHPGGRNLFEAEQQPTLEGCSLYYVASQLFPSSITGSANPVANRFIALCLSCVYTPQGQMREAYFVLKTKPFMVGNHGCFSPDFDGLLLGLSSAQPLMLSWGAAGQGQTQLPPHADSFSL